MLCVCSSYMPCACMRVWIGNYGELPKFTKSPSIMGFVKCDVIGHLYLFDIFFQTYIERKSSSPTLKKGKKPCLEARVMNSGVQLPVGNILCNLWRLFLDNILSWIIHWHIKELLTLSFGSKMFLGFWSCFENHMWQVCVLCELIGIPTRFLWRKSNNISPYFHNRNP